MTQVILSGSPAQAPVPRERAPFMLFWGDLAPLVSAMVAARPAWAARLLLAPTEVLHAVAAYLHHRLAEGGDLNAARLAAAVDVPRARDLLRNAIPRPHPRLYGLLARCGPRAHSLGTYVAVNAILSGSLGPALLRRHLILTSTVGLILRIATDPVLVACGEALMEDAERLANLEAALLLLRTHRLARDVEEVPMGSGWRAVVTRVVADLGRAQCPAAPFPIPAGWSQPRRWSEITLIGRRMQNCLASSLACTAYLEAWIAGRLVILNMADGAGLATMQHAGCGVWWISEISLDGPCDVVERHAAEGALRDNLVTAVVAGGGRVADGDPWTSLSALLIGPRC